MSELLQQLATECFRRGKPLAEIVEGLVEQQYNGFLYAAKNFIREGKNVDTVRKILVGNNIPLKIATSIAYTAEEQVASEAAEEARFKRATDEAIALYKNGVRHADVVNSLKGFAPDLAEKVAADNQHFYRSTRQ